MNPWALSVQVLVAMICHELAHGFVARGLGDTSAALRRRLCLNPFVHMSWVGSVIVPALSIAAGLPAIGWLKPLPIATRYFENPIVDMGYVAIAGPLVNLLIAAALALGWWLGMPFCIEGAAVNVSVALLNLLPVHPFDGWHVLRAIRFSRRRLA